MECLLNVSPWTVVIIPHAMAGILILLYWALAVRISKK